jgi:integrase
METVERRAKHDVKKARILTSEDLQHLLDHIDTTSNSVESDRVKLLLSYYAGLRAAEIATLSVADVTDAYGSVADAVVVRAVNAKSGRRRVVPMHPLLKVAIKKLLRTHPGVPTLAFSYRGPRPKPQHPSTVVMWFSRLYRDVGLEGCSSHSGRRSFITNLARAAARNGKSLADVQHLAGHAYPTTTIEYIEPSGHLDQFVASLPSPGRKH